MVSDCSSSNDFDYQPTCSGQTSESDYKAQSPSNTAPELRKKKKKKKDAKKGDDEEEGIDVLPIVGGVSIALIVGAPVYIVSNIKLAMFTAIGGGIMGYTTGKMFSDWG